MTSNIVSLNGLDEDDEGFASFLEEIKEGNRSAVFLLEKDDDTITVGCSFKDKKDLVYAMYRLNALIEGIIREDE